MVPGVYNVPNQSNKNVDLVFSNKFFLVLTDLFIGCFAYALAWLMRIYFKIPLTEDLMTEQQWLVVSHPWLILFSSQILFSYLMGFYDDLRQVQRRELLVLNSIVCILQVFAVTSILFFTEWMFPRTVILLFGAWNFVGLLSWRAYLSGRFKRKIRRLLILGRRFGHAKELLGNVIRADGTKIVGIVLEYVETEREREIEVPVLGDFSNLEEIVEQHNVDEIIFCSAPSWRDKVLNQLCQLQENLPINIGIFPSTFDITIGKLRHINIHDTPLIEVKQNPNEPFERFMKRIFDVSSSAVGLLLSSPIMILVSIAIKLTSKGPAFFVQERVGQNGVPFGLFKFRTMVHNAEELIGATLAIPNDPRVTYIGRFLRRFRLDELPQLWNVIKGDMSFVGPRPERPVFVEGFQKTVPSYTERHKVKPGLTGLAQVRSFYDTSPENKVKYDLAYIYNYSLSLDLLILLETLKVILTRRGS